MYVRLCIAKGREREGRSAIYPLNMGVMKRGWHLGSAYRRHHRKRHLANINPSYRKSFIRNLLLRILGTHGLIHRTTLMNLVGNDSNGSSGSGSGSGSCDSLPPILQTFSTIWWRWKCQSSISRALQLFASTPTYPCCLSFSVFTGVEYSRITLSE